jgi:Recombination endonuclease VII
VTEPVTGVWAPREESADEPACWSWPVPPLLDEAQRLAALLARNATVSRDEQRDPAVLRFVSAAAERFTLFHDGRCAACGRRGLLVDDHCHDTGQLRGSLCRSCNTIEGRSGLPVFDRYRRVHPASMLGYYRLYSGYGWTNGWSWVQHGGRRDRRPRTPWPDWDVS